MSGNGAAGSALAEGALASIKREALFVYADAADGMARAKRRRCRAAAQEAETTAHTLAAALRAADEAADAIRAADAEPKAHTTVGQKRCGQKHTLKGGKQQKRCGQQQQRTKQPAAQQQQHWKSSTKQRTMQTQQQQTQAGQPITTKTGTMKALIE